MADKKISALTAAATPLAGSEVLPIVQSGSTVKVAVNNLTAGKEVNVQTLKVEKVGSFAGYGVIGANQFTSIDVSGQTNASQFYINQNAATSALEITSDSNLKVLSGKGIDFSANTHAAGMTSELLDDYETGTWTPVFLTSGALSLPQTSTGTYTKIGNTVHFWFSCTFDAGASPPRTDVYYTTDFPFQGAPTFQNVGCASVSGGSAQFPVEAITASRLRAYLTASVTTFTGFGTLKV